MKFTTLGKELSHYDELLWVYSEMQWIVWNAVLLLYFTNWIWKAKDNSFCLVEQFTEDVLQVTVKVHGPLLQIQIADVRSCPINMFVLQELQNYSHSLHVL